ncbi:MAG: CAP domain-containing protein [Chloroflexi bacterium]|nr:MAG: CAP domain-containing protein [Chloroflexota bacterium]
MRVLGWISGLVVVAVLGAGTISATHRPSDAAHALAASRQQTASVPVSAFGDGQPDPPHVATAPSPSPKPSSKPPASSSSSGRGTAPVRTAPPSVAVRSTQQALINADRKAHGLGPLAWSSCLYNVAVSNARRIAAQGSLSHTNGPQLDLTCRLGNHAGENIGYWSQGINDTLLNNMFMNSPEHYANIMGPYHYVATAWVVAPNGYGYIAVEFS